MDYSLERGSVLRLGTLISIFLSKAGVSYSIKGISGAISISYKETKRGLLPFLGGTILKSEYFSGRGTAALNLSRRRTNWHFRGQKSGTLRGTKFESAAGFPTGKAAEHFSRKTHNGERSELG